MDLSLFDYQYPKELIAQLPLENRDDSKMMILNRQKGTITHSYFKNILDFLMPNDILVLNDSRVLPLRLIAEGQKMGTRTCCASPFSIDCLLLEEVEKDLWRCLVKPGKKAKIGTTLNFGGDLLGRVKDIFPEGERLIRFEGKSSLKDTLEQIGYPPTPPYIGRILPDNKTAVDRERYQTVFAKAAGSAAAPTAGFHFTKEGLEKIQNAGISVQYLTLHVGADTFRPVRTQNIKEHAMHGEHYEIPKETIEAIKDKRGRVIACGTTTVRALESWATACSLSPVARGLKKRATSHERRVTTIFIYPGHKFQVIDTLLTNFHQPKSTLLMLVSAFAGREFILKSYQEAIEERYRLFSYGDCMLIL